MDSTLLKQRTKNFALRVINLCENLPNSRSSNVIQYQLLKSGTSVGANYRAVVVQNLTKILLIKFKL